MIMFVIGAILAVIGITCLFLSSVTKDRWLAEGKAIGFDSGYRTAKAEYAKSMEDDGK